MLLAGMLSEGEDALICDMAETYGVLAWRGLPLETAAVLAAGLPSSSRCVRRLTGGKLTLSETLLAATADYTRYLIWMLSRDGKKGRNRPKLLLESLREKEPSEVRSFDSGEDFLEMWGRLAGKAE